MKPRLTARLWFFVWISLPMVLACASQHSDADDPTTHAGGTANAGSGGHATGGNTANSTATATVNVGAITCRTTGDGKTTLTFVNRCAGKLSVRGSNDVSGEIESGGHLCVDLGSDAEPLNSLRYWGFIGADPGGEHHTLAEMTLNTDFHDFDWYNLSHVDAHNLPMQIVPIEAADCRTLTCASSLLEDCPSEGIYRDSAGNVVSCVSPERDNPNSPVAEYFEASCKDAYSWSGDDTESMAACAGEDYDVVFCP